MRRIFFLFLLSFPVFCFGQDEYVQDTVVVTEEYNDGPVVAPPPPDDEYDDSPIQTSTPFSTIGQQPPVDVKKLPPQTVEKIKADEDYWYADLEPKREKPKEYNPPPQLNAGWLKPLLWLVMIGGLIAGVIWFLMHNDVRLFGKPSKTIAADEEPEEELTDDIFAINYDKEIRKAEEAGNYRLAVRLHYLRTLRALADRGLIDYRYGKTNSDYVMALYGGGHYKSFFGLTRIFDYTWYGQFPLSREAYEAVAADFAAFKNSLGA